MFSENFFSFVKIQLGFLCAIEKILFFVCCYLFIESEVIKLNKKIISFGLGRKKTLIDNDVRDLDKL